MKTNSIGKSLTTEEILKILKNFIFHERLQKVYHEYFSVVDTMKQTIVKYLFHEML